MTRLTWLGIGFLILMSVLLRQRLLFLIGLVLALIAAASYLWSRYCLAGVSYSRFFPRASLFYGETIPLSITIVNAKPLPLAWLRIDDEFPIAMHPQQENDAKEQGTGASARRRLVNVLSMRWYERITRRYQVRGARRGIWHFGPAQLRSGDIFGFDIRRKTMETIDQILVYPKVVPIHELGLPSRHPFGDFSSRRRIIEDPLRMMGTREYVSGDSYRHIHWKATARRQTLQTKVFEPSAARPVAIFLNVSTHPSFAIGQDFVLMEFAISAAASIARHVWEEGHPVGLYANSLLLNAPLSLNGSAGGVNGRMLQRVGRVRVAPRSHPEQLIYILDALARIEGRGRWPLASLLQTERAGLPFGATVVVITAYVDEHIKAALSNLVRKGYSPVLVGLGEAHLEQPLEFVPYYYIGSHEEWFDLESIQMSAEHTN